MARRMRHGSERASNPRFTTLFPLVPLQPKRREQGAFLQLPTIDPPPVGTESDLLLWLARQ